MDYTHTFEIKINGTVLEGEIAFDKQHVARWKTEDPIETSVFVLDKIQLAFTAVFECEEALGGLKKFSIKEKP